LAGKVADNLLVAAVLVGTAVSDLFEAVGMKFSDDFLFAKGFLETFGYC
jgi:hypothetical protein